MRSMKWASCALVGCTLVVTGMTGCSTDQETEASDLDTTTQALSTEGDRGERGSVAPIGGTWAGAWGAAGQPGNLREVSASTPLVATVAATSRATVDILVEGRGLDGRVVRRTLQTGVALTATPTQVAIAPDNIPVQSVGGVIQVRVILRDTTTGREASVGADSMYLTFAQGYRTALAAKDDMMTLAVAAVQAAAGTTVVARDVEAKAAAFERNPASDGALASKLANLSASETGRVWSGGVWRDYAELRTKEPMYGGGTMVWRDGAQLAKVQESAESFAAATTARGTSTVSTAGFIVLPPPTTNVQVCLGTVPTFRDSGTEAYLRSGYRAPASYTWAKIFTNVSSSVPRFSGQLDANGCATVPIAYLLSTAYCFQITMYSGTVFQPIAVGGPIGTGATRFNVQSGGIAQAFSTNFCAVPTFGQYPNPVTWAPAFSSPVIRGMAFASRIASMSDSGFINASPNPHRLEMTSGCPEQPYAINNAANGAQGYGEACYGGSDTAYFGQALAPVTNAPLNFHTSEDKFVIGHELGHMQQAWSVGSTAFSYPFRNDQNGGGRPTTCSCLHVTTSNRAHCLTSREYSSPAQAEGWGHFYSAKILNDPAAANCNFNYYKEMPIVSGGTVTGSISPPYATNCKTPVKWRNNKCPLTEVGTEWDWLTFLTNVHQTGTNKLSMLEITDIYQRACGASGVPCGGLTNEISWDTTTPQISPGGDAGGIAIDRRPLRPAAEAKFGGLNTPKYLQWANTADSNGVSNNLVP